MCQLLKVGWICSRGYRVMGVLNFWDARTCSRSSITMPSLWGLDLTHHWSSQKHCVFVCLSVYVTLLNDRVCAHDFAMKPLEYKNKFSIPLDRRRFVVVHSHSTFYVCHQLVTSQNIIVQKTVKFGVFRHQNATE